MLGDDRFAGFEHGGHGVAAAVAGDPAAGLTVEGEKGSSGPDRTAPGRCRREARDVDDRARERRRAVVREDAPVVGLALLGRWLGVVVNVRPVDYAMLGWRVGLVVLLDDLDYHRLRDVQALQLSGYGLLHG